MIIDRSLYKLCIACLTVKVIKEFYNKTKKKNKIMKHCKKCKENKFIYPCMIIRFD